MAVDDSRDKNADIAEGGNRKKFIPKQRTPYLLQEEVIRRKAEEDNVKSSPTETVYESDIGRDDFEKQLKYNYRELYSPLKKDKRSQLVVNKESISSQYAININYYEEVAKLYGLQKKIAFYFFHCCRNREQNETGPITSEALCNVIGTTYKTIKKIIQRMVEKKLIGRINGKRGKGGFSSYKLNEDFMYVLEGQIKLENNLTFLVHQVKDNNAKLKTANSLPEDWDKIDLTALHEAFKLITTKSQQDFGKTQLKIIYSQSKLSAADIQTSITKFAYGLKNFSNQEPYNNMDNPAAILFEKLKNGDKWEEKRYLNIEESVLFNIYKNISQQVDQNIHVYFKKWKEHDTERKYDYYRKQLSSTHFYDEKTFTEKAWEDYQKNIWPTERKSIILQLIGSSDESIINRFEYILCKK